MLRFDCGAEGGKRQVDKLKPYYIGLDCGTESVGYAVTDTEYNVLKFRGRSMWGSHVFDEAKTAAERRVFRAARRRSARKRERIRLVQSLFAEEIYKVDPLFFQRLNDSAYYAEDKREKQNNSLFNDPCFKDKDFFRKYPTIFHLRDSLYKGDIPNDPRLLYLAIHHIVKNRGHFLFSVSDDFQSVMDIKPLLDEIADVSEAVYDGRTFSFVDCDGIMDGLSEKQKSKRKDILKQFIQFEDSKIQSSMVSLLCGSKVSLEKLFDNESYSDLSPVEFGNNSFEEKVLPELEGTLSDDEYRLIVLSKGVYDWGRLAGIMAGLKNISSAKVNQFEENKKDLARLKRAVKLHSSADYDNFFHKEGDGNFSSYIGTIHNNGKSKCVGKRTTIDEFYKKIKKLIGESPEDDDSKTIMEKISEGTFLPLLISFRNSVIPYQVNKAEMDVILENASATFPFLKEVDETGLNVIQKLDEIIKFRIPYYIGPVGRNDKTVSGWAVRKKDGKILPWNMKEMIDEESSAEEFIKRMTNKCTYLPGEDVLPFNSILYSRYLVLNELNNVRVNGNLLTVEQKQRIYSGLFMDQRNVTISKLREFMRTEGWYHKGDPMEITGIDGSLKASLSSYHDFKPWIDSKQLKISDVERIIKWLTVFSDGGDMAERKIRGSFGNILNKEDIRRISRLHYSGWGRLSERFLTGLYHQDASTGELKNIINLLWETQNNLMQLLSYDYDFHEQLENNEKIERIDYSIVEGLYVSPSVKRQIWQTLKIVDELSHIMKRPPCKIFIEVTREKKGGRTVSRKNDLLSKLKNHNKDLDENEKSILEALESESETDISRRDKLYLYFTQLGKCMYSGKPINISELGNTDIYDIDHIYPFSKSGDDSLTNRVLVLKEINGRKSDTYPIEDSIRHNMKPFWEKLCRMELIPPEKLKRLERCAPLSEEDEKGFIARQLVETSQSAKATADVLKRYFGGDTQIIYSKARPVSDFRDEFGFIKLRPLNNLHHAKDAYLNIVVGNVYDTKYRRGYLEKSDRAGLKYNLTKPFAADVGSAWIAGDYGTIATVRKQMAKNDIQYTKQSLERHGALFDQMPVAAGRKNGALPRKGADPVLLKKLETSDDKEAVIAEWTGKYGGYNNLSTAYFALIRHREKKNKVVSFIPISMIAAAEIKDKADLLSYCRNKLKKVDPEIIREKVLMNTMISIDGYKFFITGKDSGGSRFTLESCIPLLFNDEITEKLKKVCKFLERRKQDRDLRVDEKHDGISLEGNLLIYDAFTEKAQLPIFQKRPSCQSALIISGREGFQMLSLENQCLLISNLLLYFGMGGGKADLSLIGGSKNAGVLVCSAVFKGNKPLCIYDCSVTGLYVKEQEIMV